MKTKHTPRPWRVSKHCSTLVESSDGRHIASTGGYQRNFDSDKVLAENEANARLIVAAPELLEALESIYACGAGDWTESEIIEAMSEHWDKVGKAIDKAKDIKG